jgi:hypothetical protein
MKAAFVIFAIVGLAGSCTKSVNMCQSDSDCTNPAYPFCDVDGQYPASGGVKNTCTIVPPDCPVARCGCTPGATTCAMNTLTICNADGMSDTMTTCDVGCETDGTACKTFAPSNALGPSLQSAAGLPALLIPDGATINTDTGVVTAMDGTIVHDGSVSSVVTSGSSMIRVFAAPTLTLQSVKIVGTIPIAFVAGDTLDIEGLVDASAHGSAAGPGAAGSADACNGGRALDFSCSIACMDPGAGGAGNALAGGTGGPIGGTAAIGGVGEVGFSLVGGCAGGSEFFGGTLEAIGGAGGGAVQFVAGTSITLNGIVSLGGGGGTANAQGASSSGGGSGGVIVFEAPKVSIGSSGGIAANGGGGGGCGVAGGDGTPDGVAAPGGSGSDCNEELWGGSGGIATSETTDLNAGGNMTGTVSGTYGGGGGSVGRARIATFDGTFMQDPSAIMSVVVTSDMLQTQ